MSYVAHYELEGLVCQGSDSIWVPLGQFASHLDAEQAEINSRWGSQIEQRRVIPIHHDPTGGYRIDAATHTSRPALNQPHFAEQPTIEVRQPLTSA